MKNQTQRIRLVDVRRHPWVMQYTTQSAPAPTSSLAISTKLPGNLSPAASATAADDNGNLTSKASSLNQQQQNSQNVSTSSSNIFMQKGPLAALKSFLPK